MSEAAPSPRHRRAWPRRLALTLLILVVVAFACLYVVTRSWFIIAAIRPQLEDRLGGTVSIARASYQGGGWFLIQGLRVKSPHLRDPAAEVLHIGQALVDVDLATLLSGDVHLRSIELDDVTLRLSEDAQQSGSFNLTGLQPRWATSGRGPAFPPTITIRRATIEVAQHDRGGAAYEVSGRRLVSGTMQPVGDQTGRFWFKLDEIDERGAQLAGGVRVEGLWDVPQKRVQTEALGLALDRRAYGMCPAVVRLWWDRMELEGKLGRAELRWGGAEPLRVSFEVDEVGLTLPVDASAFWARYQDGRVEPAVGRPRMQVSRGAIRLHQDSLILDHLVGEVESAGATDEVPRLTYEVTLRIDDLPTVDWSQKEKWIDEVVRTAPFHMTVTARQSTGARSESGPAPAEVPLELARIMQRLRLRDWQLDAELEVWRERPQRLPDGTLQEAPRLTRGRADVLRATGAFDRFPYLLEDIQARISFDQDAVVIEHLSARGAGDSQVSMSGEVRPPGSNAAIDLRLVARQVPLDDRFREALRPGEQRVFDSVLHEPSAVALRRAGRLEEAFHLGGLVDLDLRIERAAGPGQRTTTTGAIDLHPGGLLLEAFPYPMHVQGGRLLWEPDRIRIDGDGLALATAGGGTAVLSGEIALERGAAGQRAVPRLHLEGRGDGIGPALLAAIPPAGPQRAALQEGGQWPGAMLSEAGTALDLLQPSGFIDYSGTITRGAGSDILFDFEVNLREGSARLSDRLRAEMGPLAARWVEDHSFQDLSGRILVSNREIWIEQVNGRFNDCSARASGRIGLSPEDRSTSIAVRVAGLPLDEAALQRMDDGSGPAGWLLQHQASGAVDVEYDYRPGATPPHSVSLIPSSLRLTLAAKQVTLRRSAGSARVVEGGLLLEGLDLEVRSGEMSDGRVVLDGYALTEAGGALALAVQGTWRDGRLECPLITAMFGGLPQGIPTLEGRPPRGRFDAEFEYGPATPGSKAPYVVTLAPKSLALDVAQGTIDADLDPGSRIILRPGTIEIERLAGSLRGAGGFGVQGRLETGATARCDLEIDFDGRLMSDAMQALLPGAAREGLIAIGFDDGDGSEIRDGRLTLAADSVPGQPPRWSGSFDAVLATHDASFDAGVALSEVHGVFPMHARWGGEAPVQLEMEPRVESLRVLEHPLLNARAQISLVDDAAAFQVNGLAAELYGGALSADAVVGIGERRDWRIDVRVVGAALQNFLSQHIPSQPAAEPVSPPADKAATGDSQVYAAVALSGVRGEEHSRRGRGAIRALGNVAHLPVVLRIMQVAHLTAPVLWGDPDYAESEFYIAGETLTFERLLFESSFGETAPLQLLGEGDLNLETYRLDTLFRSRGGWFFRDLIGGIGDQLYVIRVRGPLGDPEASLVPLPGLRSPQSKIEGAADSLRALVGEDR